MVVCIYDAQAQPWVLTDAPIMQLSKKYDNRMGDIHVLVSPNGKVLVVQAELGSVKLWDLETGEYLRTLDGSYSSNLVYTKDGRLLAASRDNQHIRVLDALTSEEVFTVSWDKSSLVSQAGHWRDSIHLSSKGMYLIIATLYVFQNQDGKNATGQNNYASERKTTLKVWDIAAGKQLPLPTEWKCIDSFAFSPDGTLIALGFFKGRVEVWNIGAGKLIKRLTKEHSREARIAGVEFSPDGQLLAATSDGKMFLWELPSGKRIQRMTGILGTTQNYIDPSYLDYRPIPVFSPDGALIAAGSAIDYAVSDESHVVLWHVETGKQYKMLPGKADSIAFSPDGKLVVTGGGAEESGTHSDGKLISTKKVDGTVRIWMR